MFSSERSKQVAKTPDLVECNLLTETDVDVDDVDDVEVNVDDVATQKRHFLDYDAVPPPEFEENFDRALTLSMGVASKPVLNELNSGSIVVSKSSIITAAGEEIKMDKKYERDGEVSDYELAACGYTKKEFTQDDNTLHLTSAAATTTAAAAAAVVVSKAKHFLDENPIPPDYMLQQELRQQRTESPASRKSSLDRASSTASSREYYAKEPSYTLSRFLDSDTPFGISTDISNNCATATTVAAVSLPASIGYRNRLPNMASESSMWSDSRHSSMQLSLPAATDAAAHTSSDTENLGSKVECVYSLLSMLGTNNPLDMSKKFLELSRTPETCATLRRSGCVPLLVQMVYADGDEHVRKCANAALHNVVHSYAEDKVGGRREAKVLRLLDQIVDYCQFLKTLLQSGGEAIADDYERHPLAAISSLMKVSFDEEHRHAMVELGALHAIPNLVQLDHAVHGPKPEDQCCNSLRRYALMALTNLTFGDENNKALLCSQKTFMEALVAQLDCAPDDLLQVTASVLRNLSWRADNNMKAVLNEIGTVTALARAAMKNKSENTLKAILSALWNLSAHCSMNKAEFCAVDGALAFLVDMLTYEGPSKTLKIIENAGGILRNVSSHIAVREHYRQILRERNCLSILLQQLKSESLTVVSNSCGTLWNLSARCPEDQKYLWDNGAVPMLRSLIHSKHTMISEGSASALKNLLNFRPSVQNTNQMDAIARSMGLKQLPTLNVRKQKALAQELGEQHAETCENLDASISPSAHRQDSPKEPARRLVPLAVGGVGVGIGLSAMGVAVLPASNINSNSRLTRSAMLTKSESRDSVFSAKSDTTYEHMMRSHSASDANRGQANVKYTPPFTTRAAFVTLENEVEQPTEEQPVNYSAKYNEKSTTKHIKAVEEEEDEETSEVRENVKSNGAAVGADNSTNYATYQETDLDQPTDFSLRYAENQLESDIDVVTPPEATNKNAGNEIILILEDSVKCYQTEDTPYVISNAASVTDLRQQIKTDATTIVSTTQHNTTATEVVAATAATTTATSTASVKATVEQQKKKAQTKSKTVPRQGPAHASVQYGCGSYTPEKPIYYCEEGTPAGYFSRYESLSSLDETPATVAHLKKEEPVLEIAEKPLIREKVDAVAGKKYETSKQQNIEQVDLPNIQTLASSSMLNSAQETPLMFSRHSSMDSLVEADVGPLDDKSSVISDYSRLASGVISPSELPDSPTQSMPQSPRRLSAFVTRPVINDNPPVDILPTGELEKPLRSVFEDNLNRFNVENTPAQFSTATSLSNLSIMDDEQLNNSGSNGTSITPQNYDNNNRNTTGSNNNNNSLTCAISEGEEEEEDETHQDDMLLANCINMGMNRKNVSNDKLIRNNKNPTSTIAALTTITTTTTAAAASSIAMEEEIKRYCTEDTPALLSKTGSNTNLSVISICSSEYKNNETPIKAAINLEQSKVIEKSTIKEEGESGEEHEHNNRHSMNLSDDVSSNASDCGAGVDIIQQCIRDGIEKSIPQIMKTNNPIAMLRCGGNEPLSLPTYLPVTDEMNKFLVENSPCNFSVMSALSNLTVGSSLVGPAVQLKTTAMSEEHAAKANEQQPREKSSRETHGLHSGPNWHNDSLSSLSIDSEDDTNLLSQAIAAGCNRPKSNLGFCTNNEINSSSKNNNKRLNTANTALSASQPLPINAAVAAGTSVSVRRQQTHKNVKSKPQQKHDKNLRTNVNGNESSSSVDSSDSNDNQSKSLFELCILTGMHKSTTARDMHNNNTSGSTSQIQQQQQNQEQQEQFLNSSRSRNAALGVGVGACANDMQTMSFNNRQPQQQQHAPTPNRHVRERERKDEKILLECINTGITKKITKDIAQNKIRDHQHHHQPQPQQQLEHNQKIQQQQLSFATNIVPKNVQATSAAAQEATHQMADIIYTNANSTVAVSDVEKNNINYNYNSNNNIVQQHLYNNSNNLHINNNNNINHVDIIDVARNQAAVVAQQMYAMVATAVDDVHQNPEIIPMTIMNAIGFNDDYNNSSSSSSCQEHEISMPADDENNTSSDDSNVSFLMEPMPIASVHNNNYEQSEQSIIRSALIEKHKDPDLMLKSVERLTLEFVSSAEQLRFSNNNNNKPQQRLGSISMATTNNSSNNTWNEHSCPNDVSFPSLSITAPIVNLSLKDDNDVALQHKELHDFAEITPTNEQQPPDSMGYYNEHENDYYDAQNDANLTQNNSLETVTLMNEQQEITPNNSGGGINFQLGGEVQVAAASAYQLCYNNSSTNAAMTNSTIIAIEARALAENLQYVERAEAERDDHSLDLTFSVHSLDLDNVRPPSGMESLSISGYYQDFNMHGAPAVQSSLQRHMPQSPQYVGTKSPKFLRKSLPAGLMARRALGQLPAHLSGSAESINSSCNLLLDNIRPPSLMDDLLDSMISVASIQSEVADCESLATTVSLSHYETAAAGEGDFYDDNTVTLQSCCNDMTLDDTTEVGELKVAEDDEDDTGDSNSTPLCSDAGSTGSTQKRNGVKRTLTPKQKRKLVQDRFKTYTIAADMVLEEERLRFLDMAQQQQQQPQGHEEELDEVLQIEIVTTENPAPAKRNFNRRRGESYDRYKTQTIVYPGVIMQEINNGNSSFTDDPPSEEISSIRALTEHFQYIQAANTAITKMSHDCSSSNSNSSSNSLVNKSVEYEQNSETESCHGDEATSAVVNAAKKEQNSAVQMAGARIVNKAETTSCDEHETQVKVVRGRKKIAYVSPYSKQATRQIAPRLANNKILKSLHTPNKVPNNISTITTTNVKKIELTPVSNTLERQGTFIQEEPTINTVTVPVVVAPLSPSSQISSPTQRTSKLPTKRTTTSSTNVSQIARKINTTTTTNGTNLKNITPRFKSTTMPTTPQRSNSNSNIRVQTQTARMAALSARGVTTTPPSRSNSNLNNTNGNPSTGKIQQAQSRIASIWKRVDEAKAKPLISSKTTNTALRSSARGAVSGAAANKSLPRTSTFDNSIEEQQQQQHAVRTKTSTTTNSAPKIPIQSRIAVNRSNIAITRRNV